MGLFAFFVVAYTAHPDVGALARGAINILRTNKALCLVAGLTCVFGGLQGAGVLG